MLNLNCHGIVIEHNRIRSNLHHFEDKIEYTSAMDGITSLILAHHCAGIDVTSPAYIEGIETAVEACDNACN
jgi:hypothetical protein